MSLNKLARGMVEIPKGVNTGHSDNSNFMNVLDRTNTLLVQFLSSTEDKRMVMRTELEESYFNVTLYNLKDSIKNKVEQDMWNNLFKKHVSELQGKMKSKDKIEVSKAQSELSLFLDEAMGFYSKFLDVLSLIHNICLPGRGLKSTKLLSLKDVRSGDEVSEQDLYYIVQHCFVHLGDLSRYHNLHKLARINYQWAVQLNPTSGHPYNQLAILESSSVSQVLSHGNYSHLLRTVLYYDFANSCQTPFPATKINLDSLLRHVHQESVSELLTSNNSINAQNCLSSLSVAWLHSYAAMRLRNNVPRCRQLQQRIVEWAVDLVKYHEVSVTHWRDIVTIAALQCALLSAQDTTLDSPETTSWNSNLQQFMQDMINAICQGLVSISYDVTLLDSLFTETSCVSVLVVFATWLSQYLIKDKTPRAKVGLTVPFGEQFVKLLNVIQGQVTVLPDQSVSLPSSLPELQFLAGYEPLKVPSKRFNIFSDGISPEKPSTVIDAGNVRKVFIISVAVQIAAQHATLLKFDQSTRTFIVVPPIVEIAHIKKVLKFEPVFRKPVNVALASIKSNTMESNNKGDGRKNVPYKVATQSNIVPHNVTTQDTQSAIVTDVKIAKCIQDHIALETTTTLQVTEPSIVSTQSHIKEESHAMAPAPGLILSSNLPPEYKNMSVPVTNVSDVQDLNNAGSVSSQIQSNEPFDTAKSAVPVITSSKVHSYNPNREQFEKDLPPRFANKRGSSQKENKSGFKSLNYWDSTNTYPSTVDNNLTKKESEMLMMPPTVPSSWLNDEQSSQDRTNRRQMDTSMAMSPLHFQMTEAINHQRNAFNNSLQQGSMNIFQPAFNQFQNNQPMTDQDNKMKHFIQTTSSNPNNFSYQTPSDMMDPNRMKFDQMYLTQQQNFPPIPPPPSQQSSGFNAGSHLPTHTNNFDQYNMTRPNNYDKPIFSTSTQSGLFGPGYNTSPIMAQQMAQQQQQQQQQHQQKHNHQVRSNNPLLNLLPGFMNEIQR